VKNSTSVSLSVLASVAFKAMDEDVQFGKATKSSLDKVKAAAVAGAKPPVPKKDMKPFARKDEELKDAPAGTWPHFVAAHEQLVAEGWDRNELEAQLKSATGDDRVRIEKKLRFMHFLLKAIRDAMFVAQRTIKSANGHPVLDENRVKDLLLKAKEQNVAGNLAENRRAQNPVQATLTASRWVVGVIIRASNELGTEKTDDLLDTVCAFAIGAFTEAAGAPSKTAYEDAKAFMHDAVRFHRIKLSHAAEPKTMAQKPQPVTLMEVAEKIRAEEAATAASEPAPSSARTRRVRKGHRVGPAGTVEPIYAEVTVR